MNALRFSPTLNRMLRQDAPLNLGAPTRPFLEEAVREARTSEALLWLDYFLLELEQIRYIFGVWDWHMVRYYLDRKGESAFLELLEDSMAPWLGTTAGLGQTRPATVEQSDAGVRLSVLGLSPSFYLTPGDKRFALTLDTPESQELRWREWRAEIEATIQAANIDRFNQLLDGHTAEARLIHDVICDWAWALLTVIAREWGETSLGDVLRVTEEPWVTVRYEKLRDLGIEDSLRLTIEGMRGHFSGPGRAGTITVTDEPDRYVLAFDACGTGGRMRRGDPLAGSGSRLAPPYNFLNIGGAYDWTWNRESVCAYCAHCAVVNQILPIEGLGRPMRMTQYPEHANDPCRWIIYKDLNSFPDEAFTSVGKHRE